MLDGGSGPCTDRLPSHQLMRRIPWLLARLGDDGPAMMAPDRRHRTARTETEVTRKVRL
jgi:hypothetical protein